MGRSSTAAAGSTEKVTPRRGARKLGRRALAPVLWAPVLCPQVFLALFLTWFRGQWRSGLRKDRPLRKRPAGDVLRHHPESALAQACYRGFTRCPPLILAGLVSEVSCRCCKLKTQCTQEHTQLSVAGVCLSQAVSRHLPFAYTLYQKACM